MTHKPMRLCIACRKMRPQNELIRIVKDKETGKISLDPEKKLFGRGAYICKSAECLGTAEKKHGIERHLKCKTAREVYEEAKNLI